MAIKVKAVERELTVGASAGQFRYMMQAIGEVIKAWATEGHSVAIPGLITSRRVILTPNADIKTELKKTSINITCYDRNGELVKHVISSDDGDIEDPEKEGGNDDPSAGSGNGNTGGGSGNEGEGPAES